MWNVYDDNDEAERTDGGTVVIRLGGETFYAEPGDNFVAKIVEIARDYGIGKFKVVLNGTEIDNEDAPEVFNDGDVITIVKFEDPA